jgi:hypothetical protein
MQMRALVEMDNSGLVVLLEQAQYEDLARMYSLFKRLDEGLNMIRKIMGEHLKTAGSALVQDPESTKDPVDFVHRLLAMKDKYDRYVLFLDSMCKLMYVEFWLPNLESKSLSPAVQFWEPDLISLMISARYAYTPITVVLGSQQAVYEMALAW